MKNSSTAAVIGSRQFFRNAPTASRLVMDDLLHNLLVAFVSFIHDQVNIFTLDIAFMSAGYDGEDEHASDGKGQVMFHFLLFALPSVVRCLTGAADGVRKVGELFQGTLAFFLIPGLHIVLVAGYDDSGFVFHRVIPPEIKLYFHSAKVRGYSM